MVTFFHINIHGSHNYDDIVKYLHIMDPKNANSLFFQNKNIRYLYILVYKKIMGQLYNFPQLVIFVTPQIHNIQVSFDVLSQLYDEL